MQSKPHNMIDETNMVSSSSYVAGKKLSTVVPANVTGDDKSHELSNMDLALKLHYLKGLYVFESSEALQALTIHDLKKPMFQLLDLYHVTSGRIRRHADTGRPFLKCNDSGIRIVEACSDRTVGELLQDMKEGCSSLQNDLVTTHVLGPDLSFSPLVFIQFTWFKCGGISVGLSWAHVLGDAFSASVFINMWGQIFSGRVPPKSLHVWSPRKSEFPLSIPEKPISLKTVDPVGEIWRTPNNCKMNTHTFSVTTKQLEHAAATSIAVPNSKISIFELISAVIWKSMSRITGNPRLRAVIISGDNPHERENKIPTNGMSLDIVETDFSTPESELLDLAILIATKKNPENGMVEEMLEKDGGKSDFVIYGANLTFVNMLNAGIYDLEVKGQKPIFASYTIDGVGDEGAVLVLPGPGEGGCAVSVILPENRVTELKDELHRYGLE